MVAGITGEFNVVPPTNCPHHCNVIPDEAVADNAVATSPILYVWLLPVIFTVGIIGFTVNVNNAPLAL